jgi:hypothetical protein
MGLPIFGVDGRFGREVFRAPDQHAMIGAEARQRRAERDAFARDDLDVAARLLRRSVEIDAWLRVRLRRSFRRNAGANPLRGAPDGAQPQPVAIAKVGAKNRIIGTIATPRSAEREARPCKRCARVEHPDAALEISALTAGHDDLEHVWRDRQVLFRFAIFDANCERPEGARGCSDARGIFVARH